VHSSPISDSPFRTRIHMYARGISTDLGQHSTESVERPQEEVAY